jgi:hypothetical protein
MKFSMKKTTTFSRTTTTTSAASLIKALVALMIVVIISNNCVQVVDAGNTTIGEFPLCNPCGNNRVTVAVNDVLPGSPGSCAEAVSERLSHT